jgi:hypothetical protein
LRLPRLLLFRGADLLLVWNERLLLTCPACQRDTFQPNQ